MKLTLASDLHIEMHKEIPSFTGGGILLLAGDLMMIQAAIDFDIQRHKYNTFFKKVSNQFDRIFVIAGNHEHYYGDINETHDKLREYYQQFGNINYVYNQTFPLDLNKTPGVLIWGGTLWTDYNNSSAVEMMHAKEGMNDHFLIKNGKNIFSPQDALNLHYEAKGELESALAAHKDSKFIVMTHHVPFYNALNLTKWGYENLLNYAFGCTDMLRVLYRNSNIMLWHAGHTHDKNDRWYGSTRMVINPLGYRHENPDFKEVVIDLDELRKDHENRRDDFDLEEFC